MVNEESFWKQRLKVFWLRDGDKNTKFFHASITGRRKRNKLVSTVKEDGVVVQTQEEITEVAEDYFKNLFKSKHYNPIHVVDMV